MAEEQEQSAAQAQGSRRLAAAGTLSGGAGRYRCIRTGLALMDMVTACHEGTPSSSDCGGNNATSAVGYAGQL